MSTDHGLVVKDVPRWPTCRPCSICEGLDHHWLPDVDDAGMPIMICKHCPAMGEYIDDEAEGQGDLAIPRPWIQWKKGRETCTRCGAVYDAAVGPREDFEALHSLCTETSS